MTHMESMAPRSMISRLPVDNMMKVSHQIFLTIFFLFSLAAV